MTRETSGSKQTYFVQLAKEIESALRQPVSEAGGMMTLTDAYVRINRARGLELISAEDLLEACQSLDSFDSSLKYISYFTSLFFESPFNIFVYV